MKLRKKIFGLFLIFVLIFSSNMSIVFAAISTIVASDQGINYEYDIKALNNSYLEYQMNPDSLGSLLYRNFMNQKSIAFYDDVQGYIDAADVDNAYLEAQMNDEEFNTDNYTETKAAKADENAVINLQTVKLGEDGKIVITPKESIIPEFDFQVYNSVVPGKKMVIVKFVKTEAYELYDVFVGDIQLDFNSEENRFQGLVNEADAVKSNIRLEKKQQSEFKVINIY